MVGKSISFNTQKRRKAKNDFEKGFYKLLNNAIYGKTCKNGQNRTKVGAISEDDIDTIVKQQSNLTFNGIHKSYQNYDTYTFTQKEVLMVKLIYLAFSVLELSQPLMYETCYDKIQPYFKQKKLCNYIIRLQINS